MTRGGPTMTVNRGEAGPRNRTREGPGPRAPTSGGFPTLGPQGRGRICTNRALRDILDPLKDILDLHKAKGVHKDIRGPHKDILVVHRATPGPHRDTQDLLKDIKAPLKDIKDPLRATLIRSEATSAPGAPLPRAIGAPHNRDTHRNITHS